MLINLLYFTDRISVEIIKYLDRSKKGYPWNICTTTMKLRIVPQNWSTRVAATFWHVSCFLKCDAFDSFHRQLLPSPFSCSSNYDAFNSFAHQLLAAPVFCSPKSHYAAVLYAAILYAAVSPHLCLYLAVVNIFKYCNKTITMSLPSLIFLS